MSEKLEPCPFCGKPGSIDEEQSKGNPDHVVFVPSCSDSDCIGVLIQSFARRADAIAAWNRRPASQRLSGDEVDAAANSHAKSQSNSELQRTLMRGAFVAGAEWQRAATVVAAQGEWVKAAAEEISSTAISTATGNRDRIAAIISRHATPGFAAGLEAAAQYHDAKARAIRAVVDLPSLDGKESKYEAIADHEKFAADIRALAPTPGGTQ